MNDAYTMVTERVAAALEAGTVPWHRPWATNGGLPRNLFTKRAYRGMNVVLLSLGQPYASQWWLTYRQANQLGGHVRRGANSSIVTFWKFPTDPQSADQEQEGDGARHRRVPLLRHYHVFNVEQCEGISVPATEGQTLREHERLAQCEAIASAMPRPPRRGLDRRQAFYDPTLDFVGMPDLPQFETAEAFYATLFHELTHATGHRSRLARQMLVAPAPFGSPDYSKEELVAELGAAFLCAHAGILPRVLDNTAAYIAGWLSVLKQDKRTLPIAAAQAQKAADFILGITSEPEED